MTVSRGLRWLAPICGSFCGNDHGQEEERPAARAQGSAAACAAGRWHAPHRTYDPRQAAEGAEAQEEIGGAGFELGCGAAAVRAISGFVVAAAVHSATSCGALAMVPSAKFSVATEIAFPWKLSRVAGTGTVRAISTS